MLIGIVTMFSACIGGCKSWSTLTVRTADSPEVEVIGTTFSERLTLDFGTWVIPNKGQCLNLKIRHATTIEEAKKNRLYAWQANAFLVLIASEPIPLPKRTMGLPKTGSGVIAPLGRETKVRMWIVPSLPPDAEWTDQKDAPFARQLELRDSLSQWNLRQWRKSLSNDPVAQTPTELVLRLDELAIPVDGTMEIDRSTEWATTLEVIGTAIDKPVQLTFASRHGQKFSHEAAAQTAILLPLLPFLVFSAVSGDFNP